MQDVINDPIRLLQAVIEKQETGVARSKGSP